MKMKLYALATQMLFMVFVLAVGGFFLGKWLFPSKAFMHGIIAVILGLFGLVYFIIALIKVGDQPG